MNRKRFVAPTHSVRPDWDPVDRFWARLDRGDPSGCWPWPGHVSEWGYGRLTVAGERWYAHRYAWSLANGEIPEGLDICHSCNNPPCCNPAHLYLDTIAGNQTFMVEQGRSSRGEKRHNAKLDATKVVQIREMAAAHVSQYEIADHFGVSQQCIWCVVNGRTWRHV